MTRKVLILRKRRTTRQHVRDTFGRFLLLLLLLLLVLAPRTRAPRILRKKSF